MIDVEFDNLVLAGADIHTDILELKDGNSVVRGQVLARYTGTGDINKVAAYDSTGSNGLATAFCIALEDKAASGADADICVYRAGEFSIGALTFANSGDSATVAVRNDLAARGIFVKTTE
jgi:hypothetical protein